jgi:signal transduction histidine kinase
MLMRAPARGWASRVRPYLLPRSLPARVLWLTVGIILLVELLILMPSLGRERQNWLWDRITDAHLASFAAAGDVTPTGLMQLAQVAAIQITQPGKAVIAMPAVWPALPAPAVDMDEEDLLTSMGRADLSVLGLADGPVLLAATSPLDPAIRVRVIISGAALAAHLRLYVAHIAELSVLISLVTGGLVFAALNRLLVRPMRILTESIAGFRRDPAREAAAALNALGERRDDEIAQAARELAIMQDELRAALWRNARLAAVGTAVAKISHDLRNILTSALLVADRLQETADPVVKRAANTLIPAVERAADLVSRTVDFAREGPPALTRTPVALRELIDEVAAAIRPGDYTLVFENLVPSSLKLALDRNQIYRVLANLLRNAAEAGASRIVLSIEGENGMTRLVVSDNGPGLPKKVQENLFMPFTGSGRRGGTGLGLAIARDLIRAHGGDLVLEKTSKDGTVFAMGLAVSELPVNG